MSNVFRYAVLGYLLSSSIASANDAEDISPVKIPLGVRNGVNAVFHNAKLLHSRKESENNRECYVVTIMYEGRQSDLYVSPDGRHVFTKVAFDFAELPRRLVGFIVLSLIPGMITGVAARQLIRSLRSSRTSILTEWFASWVGAAGGIGIVLSQLATVPREKDLLVYLFICTLCGGFSASAIQSVAIFGQLVRGYRIGSCRLILICCIVSCVFLSLTILIDMLRVERENEYFKSQAMKPSCE